MTNSESCSDCRKPVQIKLADLELPEHQEAVLYLINAYSEDSMGQDHPLDPAVRQNLISGLRNHPTTLIFIAFEGESPVGIAVCFVGFSTFYAKPLINIHDFAVMASQRGRGVARLLLQAVEQKAREIGCCKLTLEVLENNHRAMKVYHAAGFAQAEYTEAAGRALFYAKHLV